jgi:vitamin B12 transporter
VSSAKYPTVNPSPNGYQQNSFRTSVAKTIDSKNSFGFKLFHSDGKSSYDNYYANTPSESWENKARTQMAQFYTKNKITSDWISNFTISHSQNDTKTLTDGIFNATYGRYVTDHESLSWVNNYSLSSEKSLNFGYEKDSSKLGTEVNDGTADASTKQKAIKSRVFIGFMSNYEKVSTQFNLNHDMLPGAGGANTYLIGVGYAIDANLKATATNSTAIAAPTLGQLYDLKSGGSPTLKPELSKTTEAGLQYLNDSTFARAVIFDTKYRNLIAAGQTAVDDAYWAAMGVTKYENVNSAHNTGIEMQFKKRISKFQIGLNLTHQSLVNDGGVVVRNKARNYGNLDINYTASERFDIGLGMLSTTNRTTTSPKGESTGTYTPGYSVFRVHSSYKFDDRLRGLFSLENALNKNYYQIYGYNTPGRGIFATLQYQH